MKVANMRLPSGGSLAGENHDRRTFHKRPLQLRAPFDAQPVSGEPGDEEQRQLGGTEPANAGIKDRTGKGLGSWWSVGVFHVVATRLPRPLLLQRKPETPRLRLPERLPLR